MRNQLASIIVAGSVSIAIAPPALALEKIEGTVVGTKLTACDFVSKRCEGYLTVDAKGAGKAEAMTLRVKSDTSLSKGTEKVLLPSLRGNVVTVGYVKDKGENLAKSVEVLQAKK